MAAWLAVAGLGACTARTPSPEELSPDRVAASVYADYDCAQLAAEHARLTPRERELHDELERRAEWDDMLDRIRVASVLLGRPVATADLESGDSRGLAQNYALLRGELDAVEKAQIQKRCGL